MIAVAREDYDLLSDLVSRYGLAGVTETLAQVSHDRAEALASVDPEGSKEWRIATKALEKATSKLAV